MTIGQMAFWALALLGHSFGCVELVNRIHGLGWRRSLVDATTMLCAALFFALPIGIAWVLLFSASESTSLSIAKAYGFAAVAVLGYVVASRALLVVDHQRDRRTKRTALETLELPIEYAQEGLIQKLSQLPGNQLLRLSFEHQSLPIDELPSELEGFRIAHLTDLHMSGRLTIDYFKSVVERVNQWSPDLVCLTGDIVEYEPQLDWIPDTLGKLQSTHGTLFVLGNHDEKIDSTQMRIRLGEAGLIDVGGTVKSIQHQGGTISACGDERPWFLTDPPVADSPGLKLCLAHTPDRFGWAIDQGIELTLAGHVHGGQVCFPIIGPLLCPSRHGIRYASGTFRKDASVMHVGRGTGSLFPLRYACPPEVTLITLTSA